MRGLVVFCLLGFVLFVCLFCSGGGFGGFCFWGSGDRIGRMGWVIGNERRDVYSCTFDIHRYSMRLNLLKDAFSIFVISSGQHRVTRAKLQQWGEQGLNKTVTAYTVDLRI